MRDLRIDGVLQDEASCRLGRRVDGTAADPNSPTCVDAFARACRSNDGGLYGVFVKMPPKDATATGYRYYDISWFDAVGRQVYRRYTMKFGGKAQTDIQQYSFAWSIKPPLPRTVALACTCPPE